MIRALDSETFLITPMLKAPRLVCVSYADSERAGIERWDTARAIVVDTLTHHTSVGQNIAYDLAIFACEWPDLMPLIFRALEEDRVTDMALRQKLIDIAEGQLEAPHLSHGVGKKRSWYSLAALAYRHLRKDLDKKTWRLGYDQLHVMPLDEWPEGARKYAIDDAVTTLEIYQAQEPKARYLEDQYRQTRHAFWLHLCSCWGIRTDLDQIDVLEADLIRQIARIKDQLTSAGLLRDDLSRDTKKAKARMVARMGASCKTTKKGHVSLDDEACRGSGDDLLIAYADYSQLNTVLAKDVAALRTGEIHTRFNSLLKTGRTSAGGNEENGGYNVQNPARAGGIRECFVPRPGWIFVDSDYDGLELRTMAQACLELLGHSTMADVLNSGKDAHLDLAAFMLGISYEEAEQRKKDKDVKEARQFAKIGNFGLAGGMGAATFCLYALGYGVTLDEDKAREIKDQWLQKWPEFREYFGLAGAMSRGGVAQIQQLFSGRFRGGLSYSELCNTYFQGLGADASKAAGWALTRACYDETLDSILYGCRVVNYIHDQFLVEVPDDEQAHDRAVEVARIMVEEANKWLPDVPATTTPCLARCWSKDASAVYDVNGRLVPWEPEAKDKAA